EQAIGRENMPLEASVVEKLKDIVGSENVLTDEEDLFVYSFQGPFGAQFGPSPDVVVRTWSDEEIKRVMRLAENKNIRVILRNETIPSNIGHPIIMLDTIKPSDLPSLKTSSSRKELIAYKLPMSELLGLRQHLKSLVIHQKCRECQLASGSACHGYCEVAPFFNWIETWSSKGRIILARELTKGRIEPTEKIQNILFSCTLCGHCYGACTLDHLNTYKAIAYARHELAKKGYVPRIFTELPERISKQGAPLMIDLARRTRTWWLSRLSEKPKLENAEVLYWVGCVTAYRHYNIAVSTINILREANVDFMMLGDKEGCCGLELYTSGFWDEGRKNALKVTEKLKQTRAKTLVTSCAGCYYTFKEIYPEIFGVELPMEVLHISQFIEFLIEEDRLKFDESNGLNYKVTYHDPCHLGRHCSVYEPPRNVLKAIPNLQLTEMSLNRNNARCCGGGGGLWTYNNELARNIAYSLLVDEVLPLNVEAVVTTCPMCYTNLKYTARLRKLPINVYDITEIVRKFLEKPQKDKD
ncbi:hypothetical protein DRO69_06175, partial [Candidatus Bathyarchaeota archaeon]